MTYPTEAALVTAITEALGCLGYLVARVGQHRTQGSGTTVGFPDLAVRHPHWRAGKAVLLEVKNGNKGKLSPAQEEMLALGWMHVVRSVEDALEAVMWHEESASRAARLLDVAARMRSQEKPTC